MSEQTLSFNRHYRKALKHWRTAPRLQCVECGWTNIGGRACCESCGQEDWEPRRKTPTPTRGERGEG